MRSSSESGPDGSPLVAEQDAAPVATLCVIVVAPDRAALLGDFLAAVEPGLPVAYLIATADDAPLSAQTLAGGAMPLIEVGATPVPIAAGHAYIADVRHGLALETHGVRASAESVSFDHLLHTLAEQFGACGVAVLLAGEAAIDDLRVGLRAVRQAGGLTLALGEAVDRDPTVAPAADRVVDVAQLAARIRRHGEGAIDAAPSIDNQSLERILLLLRAHTGHDFSGYKRTSLSRRIERRIGVHQLGTPSDYVALLRENPREVGLLFKELLIGVTGCFRDPSAWRALEQQVLPALLAGHAADRPLRAWVAGCSTGEEAYSLAIALHEAQVHRGTRPPVPLQVFATDLDSDAIERARAGWFPASIAADLPAARLARHFEPERGGYRVVREIRETVVFAPHNVFMDPPFTKLDLLVCRNLLIYLNPDLQARLLPLFHFSLNPGGVLFLGSAETVGRSAGLFQSIDERARLYRRCESVDRRDPVEFPARLPAHERGQPIAANLQQLAEHYLLQHFTPAAVLVNAQGDILFINGRTGRYLEPAAGRANWNVYAMARKRLGQELALTLPRALRECRAIERHGIDVGDDDGRRLVDLRVIGIDQPEALRGTALVLFCEPRIDAACESSSGPSALDQELERAREALLTLRDEMRAQQEQLKSTNEELQSANEELQSTNEELMTSKEEMQSLNEELQAVNHELQARVDELSRAKCDIENLVDAAGLAAVFVDGELRVRSYSDLARDLFRLLATDIGRSLADIASQLDYPQLVDDADRVLRLLSASDRLVGSRDGGCYRARITPYRTRNRGVDGLLMTFLRVAASDAPGGEGSSTCR